LTGGQGLPGFICLGEKLVKLGQQKLNWVKIGGFLLSGNGKLLQLCIKQMSLLLVFSWKSPFQGNVSFSSTHKFCINGSETRFQIIIKDRKTVFLDKEKKYKNISF